MEKSTKVLRNKNNGNIGTFDNHIKKGVPGLSFQHINKPNINVRQETFTNHIEREKIYWVKPIIVEFFKGVVH